MKINEFENVILAFESLANNQQKQLNSWESEPLMYALKKYKGLKRALLIFLSCYNRLTDKKFRLIFKKLKKSIKNSSIIASSHFFDSDWYLKNYVDARYSALKPAEHYLFFFCWGVSSG